MNGQDVSGALKNPSDKRRLMESHPAAELSDGFAFERVPAAFFTMLLSFSFLYVVFSFCGMFPSV